MPPPTSIKRSDSVYVSSNDVCCYVYSSLSESIDRPTRGAGMVRATVSRSFPSGTKQPYGVGSQRLSLLRPPRRSAAPQKPLRADPTVTQGRRLDPRRVTALGWRSGGGFEPPPVVVPADDRIGSVSRGLVGRAASVDRVRGVGDPRTLVPARLISSVNRSPARGPIQTQRGRAC